MPSLKKYLPWSKKKGHGQNFHHGYVYSTTSPNSNGHYFEQPYPQQTNQHYQFQPQQQSVASKQHNYPQILVQSRQPSVPINQHQLPQQQQLVTYQQQMISQVQPQPQPTLASPSHCHCSMHQQQPQQAMQPQQAFATNQLPLGASNSSQTPFTINNHLDIQQHRGPQLVPMTSQQHQQAQSLMPAQLVQSPHSMCQQDQHQQNNFSCQNPAHNYVNYQAQHANSMNCHSQPHPPTQQAIAPHVPHCACMHQCPFQHCQHDTGQMMASVHQQHADLIPTGGNLEPVACQHQIFDNQTTQLFGLQNQNQAQQQLMLAPPLVSPVSAPPSTNIFQQHNQQNPPQLQQPQLQQQQLQHQQLQQQQQLSNPAINHLQQNQLQTNQHMMVQQQQTESMIPLSLIHQHEDHTIQMNHHQQSKPPNDIINDDQHSHTLPPETQNHLDQPPYQNQCQFNRAMQNVARFEVQAANTNQTSQKSSFKSVFDGSISNKSSQNQNFIEYANIPPQVEQLRISPRKANNYDDHVYCNQNQKPMLPPYSPPPDYETFMANRRVYRANEGQHMTCHSESLIMERKEHGYENLKGTSLQNNFGFERQDQGFTS